MKTVSVTSHFDGEHIQGDEPLNLEPNTKLMVTVLSAQDNEQLSWQQLSAGGLAHAYNEEEYSLSDIKADSPAYKRKGHRLDY